jgi:ATP-dependent DNA ligase
MSVIFQLPERIQIANDLWNNPEWVVEEKYSGYRCLFELGESKNKLSRFFWKLYGDKLHDISNYFPFFAEIKTELPNTEIDVCLIPPLNENKTYLNTLFLNGPLGAEKLMELRGRPELVFLDVLTLKNVNLTEIIWNERRVYLEMIFNEIKPIFDSLGAILTLSKVVRTDKRAYFNWICENGGRGVVLKDKNSKYISGFNRNFLEVRNDKGTQENISLKKTWVDENKIDSFDYDHFLALRALDNVKID